MRLLNSWRRLLLAKADMAERDSDVRFQEVEADIRPDSRNVGR